MIVFLFFLAGCASPAPQFSGAERHDLDIEGMAFTVFVKEGRAEVIRRDSYLMPQERRRAFALMPQAAERASGCAVIRGSRRSLIPGDSGEAQFSLRCYD